MAYFQVTGTGGNHAIINGNAVTKVVDYGTQRTIYQGSDTNNFQCTETLATILNLLKGP